MAHHVTALFDSNETAQRVREALLDAGLAEAAVSVHSAVTHADFGKPAGVAGPAPDPQPLGTPAFLRELFGFDDLLRAGEYAEAMRRGTVAVVVEARWEEVSSIEQVMRRFDLVDLRQETLRWRAAGWRSFDLDAPRLSEEELVRERVSYEMASERGEDRSSQEPEGDGAIRVFAPSEWRRTGPPAERSS